MPRYYFDLQDGAAAIDAIGTDLADDEAARVQAVMFAGEYLRDHPELIRHQHGLRIVVRRRRRRTLMTVITLSAGCDGGTLAIT